MQNGHLLQPFIGGQRAKKIRQAMGRSANRGLLLSGMAGAQDAFVLSGLILGEERSTTVFIAENKEQAAYYLNSFDTILPERITHFFPDSFKRPASFEEIIPAQVQQRTDVSAKLVKSSNVSHLIITYPEALFEKVVSPEIVDKLKIDIKKGESLDVDTMIELLVSYDFKREDYVYEPGQFSIRGGIIDVFNFANEWPYRIELFDEEVESIRTFDPTTQLSIQNIKQLTIIPNVSSRFESKDKVSLMDILPADTRIWIKNPEWLEHALLDCFEKTQKIKPTDFGDQEVISRFFRERAFVQPGQVMDSVSRYFRVYLSNPDPTIPEGFETIHVNGKPQPNFNKNFDLLIHDLEENTGQGFTNILWAGTERQIRRFSQIFEDLNARLSYEALPMTLHEGFIDFDEKLVCYTDHQVFRRFHKYQLRSGFSKDKALNLRMLRELEQGDFVTHIDHGIGRYSGLEKITINGRVQESVRLIYKNNDILWVSINSLHKISKYAGKEGTAPKLDKLGSDRWQKLKARTKKKVKDIAQDLIRLYAARKQSEGYAFPADDYMQAELEASFIYEDTPDQAKSTEAVKTDMEKPYPMDRLVCGDVGFGKTEVAIRAAFKAVLGGKQVAILVPTTILALQHYKTFSDRLIDFNLRIDYINRFRTTAEKNELYRKIREGEVDIVIGTHALLNKKTVFRDLGLLVLDEEQKFGVAAKEKLRNLRINVDTLTLTATPIPRTLQFSLMGARDLSIIRTPPPNRQPIHTERRVFSDELIIDAINYEVDRGGQVFFIHNRVKNLPELTHMVMRLCPDVRVAMAHGQMEGKQLERTLLDFIDKKYDVLVSTNIIETGLDIPNANTMIINNAHQFGLSDLHQLRGRVGRSNQRAFCYLFAPPLSTLTEDARKRLKTLEEFTDLGSGFDISMRDLDIRGAGNLLGAEQSGFITDIGYETYQKILEEAVYELKENEFKDMFTGEMDENKKFVRDVEIDTDVEMLIPSEYITQTQERLNQYTLLDHIESEDGIERFQNELIDRYGRLPKPVYNLFEGLRIRWICKAMGFERFSLKNRKMRAFFVSNPQSGYFDSPTFNRVMQYVSEKGHEDGWVLKQTPKHLILIKDKVRSLKQARQELEKLSETGLIPI
jgi:transcription-repair coupling factor (superfamily II helicase)